MGAGRFRLGLRVADVAAAAAWYQGLGFSEVGSVPGPDGRPVMTILEREGVQLIVDALVGMPFVDSERERRTQDGPRGLGVAIGLGVDDLDASLGYVTAHGGSVTCEPMDMAWGDRVFEFVDPEGYLWEVSEPTGTAPADPFAAVQASWFPTDAAPVQADA